jgi:hypothetical protein
MATVLAALLVRRYVNVNPPAPPNGLLRSPEITLVLRVPEKDPGPGGLANGTAPVSATTTPPVGSGSGGVMNALPGGSGAPDAHIAVPKTTPNTMSGIFMT